MMMAASAPFTAAQPVAVPAVPWTRVDRFVGQLTHDIRNGLNAIELQLTLLGEISANAEVLTEVKALRGLLFEVTRQLQAVKTATGPVSPRLLDYPAADFFEDLRERFARLHPAAEARVAWEIAVNDAVLSIDPELSLIALLELLTNALHFGGASAAIRFLAEARGAGSVTVTLREAQPQAPGLAPQDWGRTPLLTSRRNAYGLGLFRVRQIVETQGGTLHFEYAKSDHVLVTTVTLPGGGDSPDV